MGVRIEEIASVTTESVIINETAAARDGWENPVGKTFVMCDEADTVRMAPIRRVIGMVADYHHASLHSPLEPFFLEYHPVILFHKSYRMTP